MLRLIIYPKNTQKIKLEGLQADDGAFVNDNASLQVTLKDSSGADVVGLTNVAMSYVGGSDGDYIGLILYSFSPTPGINYTLVVDDGTDIHIEKPVNIVVRSS